MSQLLYAVFISNNCASLHFWWKKNLVKYQKVSKYFENDRLQKFLMLFMYLLIYKFAKKSHIYATIYFISLKNVLKQSWNSLIPNLDLTEKSEKAVTKQGKF